MSHENVETVHRIAAAVGERDAAFFLASTTETVEWHTSLSVISAGGAYHGHDGVRRYVRDLDEAFQTFDVTLTGAVAAGSVVVAVGWVSYTGKTSGVEQTEAFGWVFQFAGPKIGYLRSFRHPEHALAAVGLSE